MKRRAMLATLAAAPSARPGIIRAQTVSAPVRIGLLNDVGGPSVVLGREQGAIT
jgi:hypothetical protein